MRLKPIKTIIVLLAVLLFMFLFTRPSDYRGIYRDVAGTFEDQWCAWSEVVGNRCDRWRKARSLIDEVKKLGQKIEEHLPTTPPLEGASPKQD